MVKSGSWARTSSGSFALVASVITFAWLAGCSAITGLDNIQEQACAPNCDAGSDSAIPTVDSPTGEDSVVATDSTSPGNDGSVDTGGSETSSGDDSSVPPQDSSPGVDAPHNEDTGTDAPVDAGEKDSAPPGMDSSTCTLGSTANCGECGRACSTAGATSTSCSNATSSGTCSPTCSSGNISCNNPAAPAADNGCECAVPGVTAAPACCGTVCPIQHDWDTDMVGTTFYDCSPAGSYSLQLAKDACAAYTGDPTQCDNAGYQFGCDLASDGGLANLSVCSNGPNAAACSCWGYDGTAKGLMTIGTGKGNNNCPCPVGGSPWN